MADYTQAQLDALRAAYAQGVLTYEYDGKRVTYRSRDEMKAIIEEMKASLKPRGRRFRLARFSRC